MTNVTDEASIFAEPAPLRERQGALKHGYRDHPETAFQTTVVHSVTDDVSDPARVRIAVDGPNGAELDIGAHQSVGGDGELPCSGDLFLAALPGVRRSRSGWWPPRSGYRSIASRCGSRVIGTREVRWPSIAKRQLATPRSG